MSSQRFLRDINNRTILIKHNKHKALAGAVLSLHTEGLLRFIVMTPTIKYRHKFITYKYSVNRQL